MKILILRGGLAGKSSVEEGVKWVSWKKERIVIWKVKCMVVGFWGIEGSDVFPFTLRNSTEVRGLAFSSIL